MAIHTWFVRSLNIFLKLISDSLLFSVVCSLPRYPNTLQDFCEVSPEKMPNYEEKIKSFYEEHFHTDEGIRYCVAGSGELNVSFYTTFIHGLCNNKKLEFACNMFDNLSSKGYIL